MNDNGSSPMTLKELSDYLKLDRATVYKMLKNKEIPGLRLNHQWRFYQEDIDKWLRAKAIEVE